MFFIIDEYRPRTGPLIWGGVLTLALFCAAWLLSEYTWTHPVFMPLTTVQFELPPDATQPESSTKSPLPLATIPSSEQRQAPRVTGSAAISTGAERAASSSQDNSSLPSRTPVPVREADAARVAPALRPQPATNAGGIAARGGAANISARPFPENTLLSYAGVYVLEGIEKSQIIVTGENGQLRIELVGEQKTSLVPVGDAKFIFANSKNCWVRFVKDSTGTVRELQMSRNGRHVRAVRKAE